MEDLIKRSNVEGHNLSDPENYFAQYVEVS